MSDTIQVRVQLKDEVLDPEGQAILGVLHHLGYDEVTGVRVGKIFSLEIEGSAERVAAMADEVLANPVIERFEVIE